MAEDLRAPAAAPHVDADAIVSRSFARGRRGFDTDEVRAHLLAVAEQVRTLQAHIADLERQLRAAEGAARSKPAKLDTHEMARLLGEETARVLETAREAADEMRAKAQEQSERLVREAADEAAMDRSEAAAYAERLKAEADDEAAATRSGADTFAGELRRTTEEAAAALRSQAEADAAELSEAAQAEAAVLRIEAEEYASRVRAEADEEVRNHREAAVAAATTARDEADADAAQTRADADEYAARVRGEADQVMSVRAAEADAEAERIRQTAELERDALLSRAEAALDSAREQAHALVAEAQHAREQVLSDLAKRRRAAAVQLEQLNAARDRIMDAYAQVRANVDHATAELDTVLPEAKMAADEAVRRAEARPEQSVEELEEELASAREEPASSRAEPTGAAPDEGSGELSGEARIEATGGTDDAPPGPGPGEADPAPLVEPVSAEPAGQEPLATEPPSRAIEPGAPPTAVTEVPVAESLVAESRVAESPVAESTVANSAVSTTTTTTTTKDRGRGRRRRHHERKDPAFSELDTGELPSVEPSAEFEEVRLLAPIAPSANPSGLEAGEEIAGGPGPAEGEEVAAAGEPQARGDAQPAGEADEVEDLFARLRASRDAPSDRSEADEPAAASMQAAASKPAAELDAGERSEAADVAHDVSPESDTAPTQDGVGAQPAGTPPNGLDEAPADAGDTALLALLEQRDHALAPVESALLKQLKRVLSDEQSRILDALRKAKARPSLDALVGEASEQHERYASAAVELLADAWSAGGAFAARQDDDAAAASGAPEVEGPSVDLAANIVTALRARLERCLVEDSEAATSGDPTAELELADRVRACYREWRSQRLGEVVTDAVVTAFTAGQYTAFPAQSRLQWRVDPSGGPCPDAEDNALAGPVEKGAAFPTGHVCPPAHPGCRCLLMPAPQGP